MVICLFVTYSVTDVNIRDGSLRAGISRYLKWEKVEKE
jgi:hypothetical protein